ncbi:MAG TPA: hypothetical protein VMM54_12940 [Nitrospirota bacterium]|nr:hypothetical protein [Nitrospirota bacterium]
MIGSATGNRISGFSRIDRREDFFYEIERQRTDAVKALRETASPIMGVRARRTNWLQ